VNKLYRKQSKNNLSTQHEFIWTTRYEINDAHCTMKLLLYVHDRVTSTDCHPCSMLIKATFYVMGIDLNN